MLYQDRRALRCVRNGVMYIGAVIVPLPLLVAAPAEAIFVAVLGALGALIALYVMLLVTIH